MQTEFKINYFWESYLLFLVFYFIFLGIFLMLSGGFCNFSKFGYQDFAALTLRITYVSLPYIVSGRHGLSGMIGQQPLRPYMMTILHVKGSYICVSPSHTGA